MDRFDELEQTTAARWSDLTDSALRCVLAAVDAPADLAGEMVDRSPGYGTKPWDTKTGRWTAAWKWGPAGLVVTIRLMPTTPS
ncbi:hypothetical protein [Umezawaea tangerina]|uniref:hypothetical protein n=1 Tax=Umezawaea tangerina TaxID=84725 RepID=UPI0014731C18|nr:hypothetical protein [Umezawaea tangerina]